MTGTGVKTSKFQLIQTERSLGLTVTSFFNDGKKATATNRFLYQKDFKLTSIPGKDWNTLLQNASHSGGINDSQIKLPLQLQWTANTGSNIFMTSPIITRQKVFIATTDDNTSLNTYICAFDFNSGKQIWKFRTENSVKNTIACEDGIIIAQDASCNLYALDAESGKLLRQQYIHLNSYPYLTEGLTIDKGIVYAGIGTGLSAYDLKNRKSNMDKQRLETTGRLYHHTHRCRRCINQWNAMGRAIRQRYPYRQTTLETL